MSDKKKKKLKKHKKRSLEELTQIFQFDPDTVGYQGKFKFYETSIETKPERFSYLDKRVMCILNTSFGKNVILGGGALQTAFNSDVPLNDYDIFFLQDEHTESFMSKEVIIEKTRSALEALDFNCTFECPQGDLFTYMSGDVKVQLIAKFEYESVRHLIDSFDFRCAMFALNKTTLTYTKQAIKDTRKKQLKLNKVTYPVATMSRIMKYKYNKEFEVQGDTLINFIDQVAEMAVKGELDGENMILYVD